jgi:hypothetical protein
MFNILAARNSLRGWDNSLLQIKKRGVKMFKGLPEMCYSTLETTGESILLKRGESGYWLLDYIVDEDVMNNRLNVTKAQAEAMKIGSMISWDCPGADPEMYSDIDFEKVKK